MSADTLTAKLDAVNAEASFVEFLAALAADRASEIEKEKENPSSPYGLGTNGWENGKIESFLEAACRWAEASKNGLEFYQKPENPWKRCADILYCGKICE